MDLKQLEKLIHGRLTGGNCSFVGLSIDSRAVGKGSVFVAIKGEQFDGHDFVDAAIVAGAVAVVVSRECGCSVPQLLVQDTMEALADYAAYFRYQHDIPFVGITGSNGKTTTRNMVASILKAHVGHDKVLVSEKNYNNHLGVPLTLMRLNPQHQFAVIEMGMNHLGEIRALTQLVKPDVALITLASENHAGEVGSLDAIAEAKSEIFEGLSEAGIAILNRDDPYYDYWCEKVGDHACLSFGLSKKADIRAETITVGAFDLETPQGCQAIKLNLLGQHQVMNALAAAAVAISLQVPLATIAKGLSQVVQPPGRIEPKRAACGALLIDDTYNANIASVEVALALLADTPVVGKRYFVLGDLGELGEREVEIHQSIATLVEAAGVDVFYTTGKLTQHAHDTYAGNKAHFEEKQALSDQLLQQLTDQDVVLVKGSRFMRMEKVLQNLL